MSSNCLIAFPDYIADGTAVFSGGSWEATLPLSNLLSPEFAKVARSTDTTLAATQFWIDLGAAYDAHVGAVPKGNFSTAAKLRLRGFTVKDSDTTPVADTGWRDLYGEVYPVDALYWGHPSLWDGKYGRDEAAIYSMPFVAVLDGSPVAQYWLLEIDDTTNTAGYVELPRVVLCPGWQPSLNMLYGASVAVEDSRPVQSAPGGADFFGAGVKRRVARFQLNLPESEVLTWAADAQWRLGTSGQLMFVWNPDDAMNMHRRSFLGRLRTLSPLEASIYSRMTAPFEIAEVVA